MASSVIGNLRVNLGLDMASFQSGLQAAQSGLAGFAKRAEVIGQKMRGIGTVMTGAITAPLAGLAYATQGAISNLSELSRQADLAGVSAQQFKVLALASEEVGIGQEKLSGILKDVNDRVGEFMQTGGGPMKDFFEQIAPQVGITAEAFRGLNSADALQLYVSSLEKANVSQQDMTFYMEALAGDASALAPLFRDNGAAIAAMDAEAKRLGLSLDGDVLAAARETEKQFRITRDVIGLQMQQALVELAPAFSQLMQVAVPVVQKLAEWATSAGEAFAALSPETQRTIGVAVALAAAIGPLLVAGGFLVSGLGAIGTALAGLATLALAHPLIAAIAAIAAGAALIYANWDGIVAFFQGMWDSVTKSVTDAWAAFETSWNGAVAIVQTWKTDTKQAIVDGWNEIIAYLLTLPAKFIEIGGQIIDGLKAGIMAKWDAMVGWFEGKADALTADFKSWFGIESPSRVFREIGRFITEGLGLGLADNMPMVDAAMAGVTDAVAGPGNSLAEGMDDFKSRAKSAFGDVIKGAKSVGDALRDLAADWASSFASKLAGQAFDGLWSAFGFANGGAFSNGRVLAFANGGVVTSPTAFAMPNGLGVMGEAGPEAIMPLTRGAGGRLGVQARGGAFAVSIGFDDSVGGLTAMVRDEAGRVVAQAAPQIVGESVSAVRRGNARTKAFMGG
jgi:hypothetical protein